LYEAKTHETNPLCLFVVYERQECVTSSARHLGNAVQRSGPDFVYTAIDNTVIAAKGPGSSIDMSYSIAVIQNSGNTIDGVNVSDNYIDDTGTYAPVLTANLILANNAT
jgi:hypothetical protein